MPLLAGRINFQVAHSGLGLTPSFRERLCEILAFILTLIGAYPAICRGLLRSPTSATQHSTTVMRHWLVFKPACLTVCSPPSTPQLRRSPVSVARGILQMLSPVSTGVERPSASSSNWRSLCTELFTALHLSTYRASFSKSPICRRDVEAGCARRPPVSLTSVRRVGDRSFAAAGPRLWHSLPVDVQSDPSLTTFRQKLKTHLFRQPYPGIVFNFFAIVICRRSLLKCSSQRLDCTIESTRNVDQCPT